MGSSELSEQARANRRLWDSWSDEYQREHGRQLEADGPAWGTWSIPEAELHVLGDVRGKDVLELGCGAAGWSIQLALRGASVVGLDNSARQLEHARRLMQEAGVEFPLVHASAEDVPLADARFDVVFSDHGATSWGDPYRVIPEAARLLRVGGLLAFNQASAFFELCFSELDRRQTPVLQRPYFDLYEVDEGDGAATFQLPYGEWIRLFRRNGLVVEDLIEPRPPADATSTWSTPLEWARQWPGESIWKARKINA
jgi:SAM-dependent methyltransferase